LSMYWGTLQLRLWEPEGDYPIPVRDGLSLGGERFQRVILVKNDGQRFVNEAEGATPYNAEHPEQPFPAALLNLPDRPRNIWAVTDAEGAEALNWPLDSMRDPDPKVVPALYPGLVAVAESLAELSNEMGIPTAELEATVSRYNGFVDAGNDEDFGKPQPLYRISKPPFCAAKLSMIRHTQPGGLRINTKAQVLDRYDPALAEGVSIDEENTIPHLYAAGETTGFLGWRRVHGKLGACASFGRLAGQNAAAETPWS